MFHSKEKQQIASNQVELTNYNFMHFNKIINVWELSS